MRRQLRIIDTNVLCVANGLSTQVTESDAEECEDFLISVHQTGIVYIDSLHLILDEYFRYAKYSGQPGIGDFFAKWLNDNQANTEVCRVVTITPQDNSDTDFEEFQPEGRLGLNQA